MADRKNWTEIFLMPVVIALVGFAGTYFITQQQESSAWIAGQAQIKSAQQQAAAERQIKVLDIFSEKITSSDPNQRILALNLLRAIEPEFATKLALAVSAAEAPKSEVKRVAQQVAIESTARAEKASTPARVYVHIREDEDRPHARLIEESLESNGFDVPGIERVGRRSPSNSQLRYFRRSEEPEANEIVEILTATGVAVKPQYISGHEKSTAIRPRHYELWLAPRSQP
ncbi:MAG TPA: hypothetical protein VF414_01035 [Thermoanaerobaculia bacterium]